jgi:hypothetical protein
MDVAIPALLILMGLGIAGIWTRDIVAGTHTDQGDGLFSARDRDSGSLFWPHWLAEYSTAVVLVVSGVGLFADASWSATLAAIGAGALIYTSTNALGWSLAAPDRRAYAAPMVVGVLVGFAACAHLFSLL